MSEAWQRDVAAIFVAVVLAELFVLLLQSLWPMLAERVRIQQQAWSTSLSAMPPDEKGEAA